MMEITSRESFVSALSDLNLIKIKGSKETQVGNLGQKALSFIENHQEIPPLERQELLLKLKLSLNQYLKRAVAAKAPLQRLAAFFGKKSSAEKKIGGVIWKASKEITQLQGALKLKSLSLKEFNRLSLFFKESPNWLRTFYQLVLDASRLSLDELQGNSMIFPIMCITQSFGQFGKMLEDKKEVPAEFLQVYKELIEFFNFYSEIFKIQLERSEPEKANARLNNLVKNLHERISNLKPGERVVISGGYSNWSKSKYYHGHAVVYEILREADGTFKFSIINTGAGASVEGLKLKKGGKPSFFTRDVSFTGIPQQAFSQGFLTKLVRFSIFPDKTKTTTMIDVIKYIRTHMKNYPLVHQKKGREHNLQNEGSCATKSIMSWLHGRLDPKTYRAFKVFITSRQIELFLKESSPLALKLRSKILEKAYSVLQKRIDKARRAGVPENLIRTLL